MRRLSGRRALVVFASVAALLAPTAATASPPEQMTFAVEMAFTGPNSAAGTFESTGAVTDSGTVVQEHFIAGRTVHGVKTLTGAEGTIVIRFQGLITPTSPATAVFRGRWVIVDGTGAYEDLHGQGEVATTINFALGELAGVYSGRAHYDPS
jgi:hypothetical protein